METSQRPRRWRRVLEHRARRDDDRPRAPRWAVAVDVVVAIFLTVVAVALSVRFPGTGQVAAQPEVIEYLRLRQDVPPVPPVPDIMPIPGLEVGPAVRSGQPPVFLVAMTALPLAVRRRFPLAVFWIVLAATLATSGSATWITVLACAIAAYGAVVHARNRFPAMVALVLAAGLAGGAFKDVAPGLPSWMGPFVVLLSVGVVGSFVRFWRHRFAEMARDQAEATSRAVAEERARIAAELHDVVTHNVSVMVIQAGAARKVMDAEPEQSKQALLAIESGGRAAMAELRHVMGLLAGPGGERLDGPADGLEPQPGLDRLDDLIERVRAAGVPVTAKVSPPGPLPPGIDLAAYRVVQEALTNTIKHAPGAAATVTIGGDDDRLEIEVTDTGGIRSTGPRSGDGRGLIGLRERLAVYGGTLEAGRTAEGGFRVKVSVPWSTP
ncbi:sensor histidine kinase [Herbidospora sp. RD11066]